ncbi:hypothetical protein ANSO36C_06920 [Nostoc cf. commune SO-36]|uniref:Putative restriction endonuclease domain-containing protein n=1 Tax=Nostoc cf. commune SO-36 TaxID=449208 RepID=A0ABM7YW66_NOSCO|nr:Uma2 family endonuclease [Nostoc commune]BDI14890.1 hypothetical protein ANSO36C_06920 [Nostoc cf. commune SO-36]
MTQALQRKLVTFEEFITKYPDNSNKRYELHDGVVIETPPPTGDHEEIILFFEYQLSLFRGSDACGSKQRIISPTLPELNLTAEQIFNAGNI